MILIILATAIGVSLSAALLKLLLGYVDSYRILLRSKCYRGPTAFPLIGSLHLFFGNTADIYEGIQSLILKYKSPFRVWMGPRLFFGLHDPEHIKAILTSPNARGKDQMYDMLKPWLGEGLVTAEVSKWKRHRKVIQPLFNTKVLESFAEVFARKASIAAEKIGLEDGKEFDIYNYMSRYSLDSICETTMGVCVDALNDKDCTYLAMVESITEITTKRTVQPWLHIDYIFKWTSMGQEYLKCIKYTQEFTQNVLNAAKNETQKYNETEQRKCLATMLLNSTEGDFKFTDKEIADEIATVIAAGYETTANMLSFTLFLLANYPEIQEKLYEEVREVFGECNSGALHVTLQDLNRLDYLDRVFKETLRHFPAGVILTRSLSDDINLGEYTLPAGSSVVIDLFQIHRSEEYWPNTLEFNPDRFLPKHPLGPRNPAAYIPFSSGPRNCIGMKYAMMSGKILISTIVSKYIIKSKILQQSKDIEMKMSVTLKPKYPMMLYAERRSFATN